MCVIYACYKGVPSHAELAAAEENNSHGGGLAWIEDGLVHWKKGLEFKEMRTILKRISPPLLIHFRIASEGPVCDELTHPFPCTPGAELALEGTAPAVLCHNGTWSGWKTEVKEALERAAGKIKAPPGPWSDSRAMAWLAGHFGVGILEFMYSPEKVAILSAVNEKAPLMILAQSKWTDEEKLGFLRSSSYPMLRKETSSKGHRFRPVGPAWNVDDDDILLMGAGAEEPGTALGDLEDEDTVNADMPPVPEGDGKITWNKRELQTMLGEMAQGKRLTIL